MLILTLFTHDELPVELYDDLVLLLYNQLELAEELTLLFERTRVSLSEAGQLGCFFIP